MVFKIQLDFENMLDQIHDLRMIQIFPLANIQAHVASDFLAWWLGAIPDENPEFLVWSE